MARHRKRVTKELIREAFGRRVQTKGHWFSDGFNVKSADGGEIDIWNEKMKIVSPSHDIYRGATILGREMWGTMKAQGSPEAVMTWQAHGAAENVSVEADHSRPSFFRGLVGFLGILALVYALIVDGRALLFALIAGGLWLS
jgi:hypothetical protein